MVPTVLIRRRTAIPYTTIFRLMLSPLYENREGKRGNGGHTPYQMLVVVVFTNSPMPQVTVKSHWEPGGVIPTRKVVYEPREGSHLATMVHPSI